MEPRIQYAKRGDGASIAFCVAGEGSPLLFVSPQTFCHTQLDWQATFSYMFRPLATNHRFVWFDWPGTGLSQRDALDFSMEAMIGTVEAVVARTGLEDFAVASVATGVPIAVTYAARRPECVSHLIIADGFTTLAELEQSPFWQAEKALRDKDWVIYTETYARILWPLPDEEFAKEFGKYLRACVEPDAHRAAFAALEGYDISSDLPRVTAPTLVVQNEMPFGLHAGQRLAAAIPGSRFLVVEDPSYARFPALINEFLAEHEEPRAPAELPHGTAIILFADIADSTGLTERMGDAAFREKARALDGALRSLIRENGGTPIEGKLLGDGVLAVFTSARQAIEAALACGSAGDAAGLPLHLGLHAGDVIREEGNVYGGAVNIAARISALSAPGELLVSDTLRGLVRTSAGPSVEGFEDRGEQELKGVGEAVRVWAVRGQRSA